jgi:hypothetical protein
MFNKIVNEINNNKLGLIGIMLGAAGVILALYFYSRFSTIELSPDGKCHEYGQFSGDVICNSTRAAICVDPNNWPENCYCLSPEQPGDCP